VVVEPTSLVGGERLQSLGVRVGFNIALSSAAGCGGRGSAYVYIPRWTMEVRGLVAVRVFAWVLTWRFHQLVVMEEEGEERAHLAGSPIPWVSPHCFPVPVLPENGGGAYMPRWRGEAKSQPIGVHRV
jgi:hypothetical protein